MKKRKCTIRVAKTKALIMCRLFVFPCGGSNSFTKTCPCNIQTFFFRRINEIYVGKKYDFVKIFARRGGSNVHPQCMYCIKSKKYPSKPQVFYIKVGLKEVYISWACFPGDAAKVNTNEPLHEKTNNLHRRKQRRRSASQQLRS